MMPYRTELVGQLACLSSCYFFGFISAQKRNSRGWQCCTRLQAHTFTRAVSVKNGGAVAHPFSADFTALHLLPVVFFASMNNFATPKIVRNRFFAVPGRPWTVQIFTKATLTWSEPTCSGVQIGGDGPVRFFHFWQIWNLDSAHFGTKNHSTLPRLHHICVHRLWDKWR